MLTLFPLEGKRAMVCRVTTFAFEGVEAQPVDVQVQLTGGNPNFHIVGLPDKAVGESRERVRAAFASLGLALPPKRVIVNLAPADLPKEGSHYDLAIALAMLAIMGVIPADQLEGYAAIGELSLDGGLGETVGRVACGHGGRVDGLAPDLSGNLRSGSCVGGRERGCGA